MQDSKSVRLNERTESLDETKTCMKSTFCNGDIRTKDWYPRNWSRTFIIRIATAISLMIVATVCSLLTYFSLLNQEKILYDSQYDALVDQAFDNTVSGMNNKIYGAKVFSELIGFANPDASAWPNVSLPGYNHISTKIIDISPYRALGYAPLVNADQRGGFSAFAQEQYSKDPYVPDGAGGLGIFKIVPSGPVPDITGETEYNSPNAFLSPLYQSTWPKHFESPPFSVLLFNLHSDPSRGRAIDKMFACSTQSPSKAHSNCGVLTDFLDLVSDGLEDLSTLFFEPIFPAKNQTVMTGFAVIATVWKEVLSDVVPSFVSGLDLVIESSSGKTYTYTFKKGKPELRGEGDKHDRRYDSYKKTGLLAKKNSLAPDSLTYTISYYPRDEFFDYYRTELPVNATIAVVLIMLLTTAIFIVHDYFLKRESNERQHVLETKRKFVRFISHEIRTPLNTVSLGLKLLESELKDALATSDSVEENRLSTVASSLEKLNDWLELTDDIFSNNESAISVLNDLLNYDKIQMGAMTLDCSPTNLWLLNQKLAKSFAIQAKQVGVSIIVDLELHRDGISTERHNNLRRLRSYGDEMRLTQVLRNLISNALKFTPRDGKVLITVDWNPSGLSETKQPKNPNGKADDSFAKAGSLLLSFKDTGAGLSKEQLTRIFTEGVQFNAKELQAGQGSGLGLAISKGLIAQHGGTLTVASEGLGKGCTFLVELPVVLVADDHSSMTVVRQNSSLIGSVGLNRRKSFIVDTGATNRTVGSSQTQTTTQVNAFHDEEAPVRSFDAMKLLVVDDSLMNRKMLTRLLVKQGHRCIEAEDGLLAVEQYKSCPIDDPFDCILMDYEMPNLNGPEAAKQLRELGCTLVIVGVTGNVLPEDRKYYLDMGANAVLPKPLNIAELEEVWSDAQWVFSSNKSVADNTVAHNTANSKSEAFAVDQLAVGSISLKPSRMHSKADSYKKAIITSVLIAES